MQLSEFFQVSITFSFSVSVQISVLWWAHFETLYNNWSAIGRLLRLVLIDRTDLNSDFSSVASKGVY